MITLKEKTVLQSALQKDILRYHVLFCQLLYLLATPCRWVLEYLNDTVVWRHYLSKLK